MCQISAIFAAILILVGDQCDGNTITVTVVQETTTMPTQELSTNSDNQIFPQFLSNAVSSEEQQGSYAPSTVNFHDIYSNTLGLLAMNEPAAKAEDPLLAITVKDDVLYHLNSYNKQLAELRTKTDRPSTLSTSISTSPVNSEIGGPTTVSKLNTEEGEENVGVIPIKGPTQQRGVLDLLFPAARVKTFKLVFDTFKRLMSNTFR